METQCVDLMLGAIDVVRIISDFSIIMIVFSIALGFAGATILFLMLRNKDLTSRLSDLNFLEAQMVFVKNKQRVKK